MDKKKINKKPVSHINKSAAKTNTKMQLKHSIALLGIILVSFCAYFPVLSNGFVNWDDDFYIQNNLLIRSIDIKQLFSQYYSGNYHPLTMLVFAIEYQLFGLSETGYHSVNLLLHLLNVLLVFRVVSLLSNKIEIALIVSLLFGIHPMHVESVAWASELKDLLYTFFFLASYIFYLKYIKDNSKKYYFYALLLFLLSLFSKAMAVSLPVLFILTDYFKGRKINTKTLAEKIPFFIMSVTFGILAVFAQKSFEAIQEFTIFSFPERIVFACYGFITYVVKLLIPVNLSAYYPYPVRSGTPVPVQYYFYVILLLGMLFYIFYSIRFTKKIFFGISFFAITVFLVLQLLPVGGAVMADRYSYIPSIGIFYLAGEGLYWLWTKKYKSIFFILFGLFTVFYSTQTFARCRVWKDGKTLWDDVIRQYQTIPVAYNNRGFLYYKEKKYKEALEYNNKAIELLPEYHLAYNNRGILMAEQNKNTEAFRDYSKAIEIQPNYKDALYNRGILLLNTKKYEDAINDFSKVIQLNSGSAEIYINRSLAYMNLNKFTESHNDLNKAIEIQPGYSKVYFNRGLLFTKENKNDDALNEYSKAIKSEPTYTDAYFNRALIYQNNKKINEALHDYNKIIELKPGFIEAYYNSGVLLINEKKYNDAITYFSKLIEVNPDYAMAYYNRGVAEYYSGKIDLACIDLQKAAARGAPSAQAMFNVYCH